MNESSSLVRVKRISTGLAFILDQHWLYWVRSYWRLSAMLARRHEVPVSDIRGHQDYAPGETVCPGENIYRYLRDGTITDGVAQLLFADHRPEEGQMGC